MEDKTMEPKHEKPRRRRGKGKASPHVRRYELRVTEQHFQEVAVLAQAVELKPAEWIRGMTTDPVLVDLWQRRCLATKKAREEREARAAEEQKIIDRSQERHLIEGPGSSGDHGASDP